MKKKTLLTVCLSLVLALSMVLAACGGGSGGSGGSSGGGGGGSGNQSGGTGNTGTGANQNLTITSNNANYTSGEYRNVTVDESVGNGTVSLSNLKITGDLTIRGGGSNSIKLNTVTIGGTVVIDKDVSGGSETPRLELTNTPVNKIEADRPAIIQATDSKSAVETITVPEGKTAEVTVKDTAVKTIEAKGTTTVTVDNATIGTDTTGGIIAEGETTIKAAENAKASTIKAVTASANVTVAAASATIEQVTVQAAAGSIAPVQITAAAGTIDKIEAKTATTVAQGENGVGTVGKVTVSTNSEVAVDSAAVSKVDFDASVTEANVTVEGNDEIQVKVDSVETTVNINADAGNKVAVTTTNAEAAGTIKDKVSINNITVTDVKTQAPAPSGLSGIAPLTANGTGTISGLTAAMEISTDNRTFTMVTDNEIAGVAPGAYYVRLAKAGTLEASDAVKVTVPAYTAPVQGETLKATDAVGVVDLGWSQFVVVRFAQGYSMDNVALAIDGVDVSRAFTPVTDDGSIVKWELEYLNPGTLTATDKTTGARTAVAINKAAGAVYDGSSKPAGKTDTSPGYMIAHGPVAIWDYYLTNYDKDGNARVEPAKTTFNITGTAAATDAPAFWSPDTELKADGSGQVVIMFNKRTAAEQAWFEAIENSKGSVQLVAFNDELNTLNDHLTFKKEGNVPHGANNYVNEILIDLGQDNFCTNGRYYIRVFSKGHDTVLVPIHVVNEKAPTLSLSGSGTIVSGQNLSFAISDMPYAIQNPIYAVDLTRPDGETVALTELDDFYQIGDTLFVYNYVDAENSVRAGLNNNIPYNGAYTMTVHSHGFKDMSITFTVTGGKNPPVKSAAWKSWEVEVDAVSSATYSGSTTGGDGSGGSSYAVSADLKFNADLLINAMILERIGIRLDAAKSIVDRWESDMAGWDSVSAAETANGGFDWSKFITAVSAAREKNEYLCFADYASGNGDLEKTTIPHAVKSVLEDNMLGDIQFYGGWIGKDVPKLTLVQMVTNADSTVTFNRLTEVLVGEDIYLFTDTAAGIEYLKAIKSVNLNGNSADLTYGTDYVLAFSPDNDNPTAGYLRILYNAQNLTANKYNVILLDATGYKDARLRIFCANDMERNVTATAGPSYERGSDVVITVTGDDGGTKFAEQFKDSHGSITVTLPSGMRKTVNYYGYQGYTEYYEVSGNKITIHDPNGSIFNENGDCTLTLTVSPYNGVVTNSFTVTGTLKTPPAWNLTVSKETHEDVAARYYYLLNFGANDKASGLDTYKNKITAVVVNGVTYSETNGQTITRQQYDWPPQAGNDLVLRLYGATVFNKTGDSTVVIYASGYETLTLTLNVDGTQVTGLPAKPADKAVPATVTAAARQGDTDTFRLTFARVENVVEEGGYAAALRDYLGKVDTVTVTNGEETTIYKRVASLDGVDKAFSISRTNSASGSDDCIDLPYIGYGDNKVVISAAGYVEQEYSFTYTKPEDKAAPAATLTEANPAQGSSYVISFASSDNLTDYLSKVYVSKVTENGEEKEKNISLTKESNTAKVLASAVKAYGTTTVLTLTAEGYTDQTVTIDNSDKVAPAAPKVQKVEVSEYSGNYKVYFSNDSTSMTYVSKITGVTVGGEEYSKDTTGNGVSTKQYHLGSYVVELDETSFITGDETTVVFTSENYQTLTFKVKNNKLVKETPDPAPAVKAGSPTKDNIGGYRVQFEGANDTVKLYLNAITAVTVKVGNTEPTTEASNKWAVKHDGSYGYDYLWLSDDLFPQGEEAITYTVTIETDEKEYTPNDTVTIEVAAAPVASADKDVPAYTWTYQQYYPKLTFTGDGASDYLSSVSQVKVNETTYNSSANYYPGGGEYMVTSSSYSGYYVQFGSFSLPDGSNLINISVVAAGYKDLVFYVNKKGQLVTDPNAPMEVPSYSSVELSENTCWFVNFGQSNSDYTDYIAAITSVTVGGVAYSPKSSDIAPGDSNLYYFDRANQTIDMSINGFNGVTKIIIKATGYNDLEVEVPQGPAFLFKKDNGVYQLSFDISGWGYGTVKVDSDEVTKWINAITSVEVDGVSVSDTYSADVSGSYYYYLKFDASKVSAANSKVIIHATGYGDTVLDIKSAS